MNDLQITIGDEVDQRHNVIVTGAVKECGVKSIRELRQGRDCQVE